MRRSFLSLAATFSLVALLPLAVGQNLHPEQHLRDEYKDKVFVLRGFYSDYHLRYDSTGTPIGRATAGDWTSDGFVLVQEFYFSHKRLVMGAQRLEVVIDHKEFRLRAVTQTGQDGIVTPIHVEMKIDLGEQSSPEQFNDAIARIFLTRADHLSELVPDYWKPCVPAGLIGRSDTCQFSPDILGIPGVAAVSTGDSPTDSANEDSANGTHHIFRVGNGVKPPRAKSFPDPEFSEPARRTKYQGTTTLGLTVTEQGIPTNIHVLSPLGAGLDARAVQAVEKWKFSPAEKDGQPVAVQIAVEVDFHLY
jgi:TonB family protein